MNLQLPRLLERDTFSRPDSICLAPAPLLDDIGATEHFVQFYEEDSALIESVSAFLSKGLRDGISAIVIATQEHRRALEVSLAEEAFDLESLRAGGRYVFLDAAATLARFMVDGAPDPERFQKVVGGLVEKLVTPGKGLSAFGEMVALLCAEGNSSGAIALEELWNELAKKHTFALFCAYPIKGFSGAESAEPFIHICQHHTRVIPAESYSRDGMTADDRLRTISRLQQKAATLEAEITIRKQCQAELAHREADLRDFLENATEGIHQVNSEGKVVWANRAELELIGYERCEVIGHDIAEFHADPQVIADIWARLKRGEKLQEYEARLKHKDGSIRYVSINSSGRWVQDEFVSTRCFTRDITERKLATDRLNQLVAERTAELQATVADLEAFSYSISHDMRSPLRAIQAYATSILEDYHSKMIDAEGEERLDRIQRSAARLDLLIRDVLAYSKIAKSELVLKPISLERLVREIIEQQFQGEGREDCIEVGRLHDVCAHEAYLTQCLTNLFENGLKFVNPGCAPRVHIESRVVGEKVRIAVKDNGIGISPDQKDRVFKIFGRVHSEKQYPGTGIGLAIVNKAVARMGGEVGYNSELGKGTEFWITLRAVEHEQ